MEYKISLEDLELNAIIGILPHERKRTQKILVCADFIMQKETEFLDYRYLRDFIKEAFKQEFRLLEDAQEFFLNAIPKEFKQVREFTIKITKLEIFEDCKVSLSTHYKRN